MPVDRGLLVPVQAVQHLIRVRVKERVGVGVGVGVRVRVRVRTSPVAGALSLRSSRELGAISAPSRRGSRGDIAGGGLARAGALKPRPLRAAPPSFAPSELSHCWPFCCASSWVGTGLGLGLVGVGLRVGVGVGFRVSVSVRVREDGAASWSGLAREHRRCLLYGAEGGPEQPSGPHKRWLVAHPTVETGHRLCAYCSAEMCTSAPPSVRNSPG